MDTQVVAKTDYLLLMDMAKELCMVENNDKGKKARRYFIEKEKELKKLEKSNNDQVSHLRIPDFSNPAEAARERVTATAPSGTVFIGLPSTPYSR